LRASAVPPPVRPGLPALWRGPALVGVPHLDQWLDLAGAERPGLQFAPNRPLAEPGFTVALIGGHII
jgi:hypothetical protein